jgi:hypothetical protein
MPTAIAESPSKSEFVRQFLRKNRNANRKTVEEAWLAAGHEGSISSSVVSTLRRELGLIRKKRGGSQPAGGNAGTESATGTEMVSKPNGRVTAQTSGRRAGTSRAIAEIEGDIDRLIFKLMKVGGMEDIEGELRKVRRLLYSSLG